MGVKINKRRPSNNFLRVAGLHVEKLGHVPESEAPSIRKVDLEPTLRANLCQDLTSHNCP